MKQQIGNYLIEKGDYELALPYFVSAIEIEPEQAIYHYQLGELLANYRQQFIEQAEMPEAVLDDQMLESFKRAAQLAPNKRQYQIRYAEAFFDAKSTQQWEYALEQWERLEITPDSQLEADIIALQKARVLIELNAPEQAKQSIANVQRPSLEENRQQLLSQIERQSS